MKNEFKKLTNFLSLFFSEGRGGHEPTLFGGGGGRGARTGKLLIDLISKIKNKNHPNSTSTLRRGTLAIP